MGYFLLQGINSFPGKLRLCSFAAVKVVIDKGGIIAVNGTRRVEQYRFQILLDIAHFGCVLPHAIQNKLNMAAVQLQKL
ncbi:hypothetical protein BN190_4870002 [Clostridioides difficile T14]|nr:hypothetical protein BN190_4870002 [Clostridioides difficile T14]